MMDESVHPRSADLSPRPEPAGAGLQKVGPELLIGSNIFRNTNGVVKIDGKEQLVLEYRPEQALLWLTIDLYGEAGDHIAHVRRNRVVLNQGGRFSIESRGPGPEGEPPSVRLWDQQSGVLVCEANAVAENKIRISAGKFYSHKGQPVEITPHYCRIGSGTALFGDIVESRGGTVVLG
ncbi:hypothetical protein [Nitrospira moscoviensis]|uniref:Uncharacterized protein n=1 Tax=Nitrospira moscoviensis TaxID=42253 RepID=A0A0K2GII8_NITMO|nr:hypothetical protein [Nitrospira moscoviensis]ALA60684.1 hypothetical protein NITMOv2_4308 [Nitrospira moscoviensis]